MRLPEQIEVSVSVDGKPLGGVLIHLTIVTTFKNDFVLLFGPTGVDGKLVISRDEMIREALREQELFIMDYGDPEIHFSGVVLVAVFGKDAIKKAIDVYPDFKDAFEFPPGYLDRLHRAQEILENLADQKISVDVRYAEAGNLSVRVENN
jgi:hypothetical protein